MELIGQRPCPLPDDPVLAAMATALNEAGHWAEIVDPEWRGVFMTDEGRLIFGGRAELAPYPLGAFNYGPERCDAAIGWRGGQFPLEILRRGLETFGPSILADLAGGSDGLRALVDPRLADIVDGLEVAKTSPATTLRFRGIYTAAGTGVDIMNTLVRLNDVDGRFAGTALILKPAVGMAVLTRMTAMGDSGHFDRVEQVVRPDRRPAAVLFADLESSSHLARRLSTAGYFALVRRLARVADQSVVDAGGLVGTHAGDGVVAFFLAETAGSESAAARACIEAARALSDQVAAVAARSDLSEEDVVLRFGMHWGANLYIGQITTSGRTEVTALGDQVNEASRIEACASGGRTLASKDLVERLAAGDAADLGLALERITYTALADLDTATVKARRDAPAIPVCEV